MKANKSYVVAVPTAKSWKVVTATETYSRSLTDIAIFLPILSPNGRDINHSNVRGVTQDVKRGCLNSVLGTINVCGAPLYPCV